MKFRRKQASAEAEPATTEHEHEPEHGDADGATPPPGPYDVAEAPEGVQRVDLGSLLLAPAEGRELRLQVDEKSGAVRAVILAGADGAVEIQAFAAPRNGDLWGDVRPQIAADVAQRGGVVAERQGTFGTELLCQMPVKRPDGTPAMQPSRIVGVNGPRWMLRASLLGRPALEPDSESAAGWEAALRQVVVRRGEQAMPVGEPLPVTLPDDARRVG